jgi:tight adherence protein C
LSESLPAEAVGAVRAGGALAGVLLTVPLIVLWPPAIVLAPALGLGGALAPTRWLGRREAARRAALVRELPDLLDLLGICVESGMALDPALELAAGRLGGTIGLEIERVLRDLALGTPRAGAYRALLDRAGAPELARTVGALLQAEELGAPLSRALEGQAEALRLLRRQTARERAGRAAPKIQLVVALLMVPAVLLLVLGALVIELSRQVGSVVGGP